jgi:hypothetical protein
MNGKAKLVVITVLITLIAVGLSYPFGPSNCSGTDCYRIGPFAKPGGSPGPGSSVTVSVLFPGTITYSDGSTAGISSAKSVIQSVTAGPSNKAISKVNVAVQVLVTSTTAIQVTVKGYIAEAASRTSADSLGAYFQQTTNTSISTSITIAGTALPLLNVTRYATDFQSMSDLGSRNSTHFNYNLVGALNFNIGMPVNKSVSSIFAWPNLPTTITTSSSSSGGGGGGGGGCGTSQARCITILGTTPGVAYNWYVLGTFPAFSVASASSGRSILQRLGIL